MTLTRKSGLKRTGFLKRSGKLKPRGAGKAKRQARNAAYYRSSEWRAKRNAVFERDGYRCTEIVGPLSPLYEGLRGRCPNRGEIVNGKQTGRGLVCEETSYGHRGIPDRIDTCKTRCRDCDRRLTPLERVNHAHGFNNGRRDRERATASFS